MSRIYSNGWIMYALLFAAGAIVFFSGLSIRSLWGSEGRWAVIAREIIQSGNYFIPTINGEVYFDKPLLSYWAIIPFYNLFGFTEAAARAPSALAGVGVVMLVYGMGKHLFGVRSGVISSMLMLTTYFFLFWSRTASAEILNLLTIWLMLWMFIIGGKEGRYPYVHIFYIIGAIGSFCKGPVAMAVPIFVIVFYSFACCINDMCSTPFSIASLKNVLLNRFKWLVSSEGLIGILAGALVFAALLFLPVIASSSWESLSLMWRENVMRFFTPFDHKDEPFYAYFIHGITFSAPWTFILLFSLGQSFRWDNNWKNRFILITAIAIFLFFTISGSRRGYYILPILPAFALIMGKCVSDWCHQKKSFGMLIVCAATALIPVVAGTAMLIVYLGYLPQYNGLDLTDYKDFTEIIVGPLLIAGGILSFLFTLRNRKTAALAFLMTTVFILEMWGFTSFARLAEKGRTLKPFCEQIKSHLNEEEKRNIGLFRIDSSSLIYYLDMKKPIPNLSTHDDIRKFEVKRSKLFLLTEALHLRTVTDLYYHESIDKMLEQEVTNKDDREGRLVLLKIKK